MSEQDERTGKRSPIKQPPLPQAGESTHTRAYDIVAQQSMWFLPPLLCGFWAVIEWNHRLTGASPNPWVPTVLFGLLTVLAIWNMRRLRPWMANYALGAYGERAVGETLESLRARGYRVFHDLQQEGWNIDHVLIGPAGVFAIETKLVRKPNDHDAKIVYNGRRVLIDGLEPDRDPIKQALASARRVREILKNQTGQDVPAKPVVLYPGWFIEPRVPMADVYVANETWFLKSFDYEHARRILDDKTIALLAAGMEREARRR